MTENSASSEEVKYHKKRCIYRPRGMGIRLIYKCVIGCRHCYQKSFLGSDVSIDKARLLGVLEEGREAGISTVGFSGGEPFLCADTVFKGVALARKLGYDGNVGVVTNGFWGKTEKSAKKVVGKLAEAGFTTPQGQMSLSVGEFHQEWVTFSTVANVVSAYWEQFKLPIQLLVTFSRGNKGIYYKLCDYFAKRGIPKEAYNSTIYPSVAHVGRADEELSGDTNPTSPVRKFECTALNKFTLEPTGNVAPCCGFNRFIHGICVGNIHENTVPEIIENTNTNIIYHYLKYMPLYEIHELLSKKFKLKSGYRQKCEVCKDIFGNEKQVAYLENIAPTALSGILNPGSKPGSTRFFHDDKAITAAAIAGPANAADADLAKKTKHMEAENARLRRAIADLTLEKQALTELAQSQTKRPVAAKSTPVAAKSTPVAAKKWPNVDKAINSLKTTSGMDLGISDRILAHHVLGIMRKNKGNGKIPAERTLRRHISTLRASGELPPRNLGHI